MQGLPPRFPGSKVILALTGVIASSMPQNRHAGGRPAAVRAAADGYADG